MPSIAPAPASSEGPLQQVLRWLGILQPMRPAPSLAARPAQRPPQPVDLGAHPAVAVFTPHSVDPGEVRAFLVRALFGVRDGTQDPGDLALIERLLRALGSETLALPVFPDVANRLDRLLRGGQPSITEVAAIVRREPDLVRRVWLEASSASYARGVTSLDHAIARIGFDALWRISMTACFYGPVFRVPGYEVALQRLRVQGVATAEVAGWLADDSRGDAYLAGLLHPSGALLVFRAAVAPRNQPAPQAHTVLRLARQLEAGLAVLVGDTWGLGLTAIGAMGFYPEPALAPSESRGAATVVHIARLAVLAVEDAQAGHGGDALHQLEQAGSYLFDARSTLERANQALAEARRLG